MLRVAILTSSRADYGIYLPLLKRLKSDDYFKCSLIVFGSHLSEKYGYTYNQIVEDGFEATYQLNTISEGDSPFDISVAIGNTIEKFAKFWDTNKSKFDLVFCLGDRYEMFSAVIAGVSFQIAFAHLHGGETTLGAIDNIFRHSITLASKYHFVSTKDASKRVFEIIQAEDHIYNVGALSLDNFKSMQLLSVKEFEDKWGIDFTHKTILTTFHPETISHNKNAFFAEKLVQAIEQLNDYQVLITMPNADTNGSIIREVLIKKFTGSNRVFLIENLGSQGYFTAIKYCSFLLGNTSSGIIEAASFGKYVINLGNRQKGRTSGINVLNVPIETENIILAVKQIESSSTLTFENCYYNGGAVEKIVEVLKNEIYK